MKHLKRTLATYVYNHGNMCNIPIYFYHIHMKCMQHISETIEAYSCNMHFQRNIFLLLGGMEARRCVVFTGGSGRTSRKGGIGHTSSGEAVGARLGEGSRAPHVVGLLAEHRDSEVAARRA
jgi:hypothetical protein